MSLAREFQQYKAEAESTIKEASAGQGKALKGRYYPTLTTTTTTSDTPITHH